MPRSSSAIFFISLPLYFFLFFRKNLFNKYDQNRNNRNKITENRRDRKGKQSIYKLQRYSYKIVYAQAFNIGLPKAHNSNARTHNGKYAFYPCKSWQCTEQCKYTKKDSINGTKPMICAIKVLGVENSDRIYCITLFIVWRISKIRDIQRNTTLHGGIMRDNTRNGVSCGTPCIYVGHFSFIYAGTKIVNQKLM